MPEQGTTFTDKKLAQEYASTMRGQGFIVSTRQDKKKGVWIVYVMEKPGDEQMPITNLADTLAGEGGSETLEGARKKTRAVGSEVERYGGRMVREAITGTREPISGIPGAKVAEKTGKSIAKHASMRKVIPVAADSAEGYTYFARIGKTGAPKIAEDYPGEKTPRITNVPGESRVIERKAASGITIETERPRIAEPTQLKTKGKLTAIPYFKDPRKEKENGESVSN